MTASLDSNTTGSVTDPPGTPRRRLPQRSAAGIVGYRALVTGAAHEIGELTVFGLAGEPDRSGPRRHRGQLA